MSKNKTDRIISDEEREKRREAGRRGGATTRDRHGKAHYARIGLKGGEKMKERGKEFYSMIGKMGKKNLQREENQ